MTVKTQIIDVLGEKALLLPALLQSALTANERAKYVLSVLQMAMAHADRPDTPAVSLKEDREACGIADPSLDRAVERSESNGDGRYVIPGLGRLIAILDDALRAMLAPLGAAAAMSPQDQEMFERFGRRLDTLLKARPAIAHDRIDGDTIAAMASGEPPGGDGVHLLVMALHKEIDRLQAAIATEEVNGAKAYGIRDSDRPLIAAFMTGVNRTAPVKFDHPGLATIAVRQGDTLLLQNDIGDTEAHVLVMRITGLQLTLTHSDVHAQRLRFFQRMLAESGMEWEEWRTVQAPRIRDTDFFYVTHGKFTAADPAALAAFLDRLGSRLVFLIDWNKARKRLDLMVPNDKSVEILDWAAAHDLGHRGFLQLGGERLIYEGLEQAVKTGLRYGEPLHAIIGTVPACDYLRYVLETAATGLLNKESEMLIRGEIRAELSSYLRSAQQQLLGEASRHAGMIAAQAAALRDALRQWSEASGDNLARNAVSAKRAESEADDIVKAMRETVQRVPDTGFYAQFLEIADDAMDEIEDAAFLAGLLPGRAAPSDLPPSLRGLSEILAEAAQAFRGAIDAAQTVHRGAREQTRQFLEAVDRLVTYEHQSDERERAVTAALLDAALDPRHRELLRDVAAHLEAAADRLLLAGLALRDHVLGEIVPD